MTPEDRQYILDALTAVRCVDSYTRQIDRAQLDRDSVRQDGLILQLQIIGEALSRVSDEFRAENDLVPWERADAIRDYFCPTPRYLDLDTLWQAATQHVPALTNELAPLVRRRDGGTRGEG